MGFRFRQSASNKIRIPASSTREGLLRAATGCRREWDHHSCGWHAWNILCSHPVHLRTFLHDGVKRKFLQRWECECPSTHVVSAEVPRCTLCEVAVMSTYKIRIRFMRTPWRDCRVIRCEKKKK